MENKKIILVTGGQRSGKSYFSESLATDSGKPLAYVATAQILDEEFRERVKIHQDRRGPEWTTFEAPFELGGINLSGHTVVIDCVTMWLTNVFFKKNENVSETLDYLKKDFINFTSKPATYIFVTNEIGLGGIGATPTMRKFADAQGWINQFIASHADEVYFMVSGIPMKLK